MSIAWHLLFSVNGKVQLPRRLPPHLNTAVYVEYQEILAKFPKIVGLGFTPGPVKHNVHHHVETKGSPILTPAHHLVSQKYAAAKAEFKRMEKTGIMRRSNSPWSSALHMVIPKPVGSWPPVEIFADSTM